MLGTFTTNKTGFSVYDFVSLQFAGHKDIGKVTGKHQIRYEEINQIVGDTKKAKRVNRVFRDYVPIKELNKINPGAEKVTSQTREEIMDSVLVERLIPLRQVPLDMVDGGVDRGGCVS